VDDDWEDVESDADEKNDEQEEDSEEEPDEEPEEKKDPERLGCKHYYRGCLMECPDYQRCGKGAFYACRLCHDEIHFDEEMDPKKNH